ncbi:MAG: TonB-dependent receptor, partial [Brevinematales bacterium]|nr:TonB-dependent receptor [Brevinematales bacterium]
MQRKVLILLITHISLFGLEIKGKVKRIDNMSAIQSARVILTDPCRNPLVVETAKDGSFKFENIEKGSYDIEIKALGFFQEKRTLKIERDIFIIFYLTPLATTSLGEIEVKGEREKTDISKTTVDRKTIQKATTHITGDPVEVLKSISGVETGAIDDFTTSSKFLVRGGEGFETIGLYDEVLVNYFFHRVFPDSIFIDDLIDEITLYKGFVPIEYGQLMSGLLKVKTIKPQTGLHGKLSIGTLNSYISLNGISEDEKWEYLWGIRRTHYDLVLNLFLQKSTMVFALPYYIDSQGKIKYNGESDKISISYVYSFEHTKISNFANTNRSGYTNEFSSQLDFQYFVTGIQWEHFLSENFFVVQNFGGAINYQGGHNKNPLNQASCEVWDNNLRYKIAANLYPFDHMGFKSGFEVIYYPDLTYSNIVSGDYISIITSNAGFTNFVESYGKTNFLVLSGFLSGEFEFFDKRVFFLPGLRVNYYNYVEKFSYDPRFVVEYRFNENHKTFFSIAYLSQLTTEPYILTTLSKNRNEINIPGVWHYVIGENSKCYDFELNIEGYLKKYENIFTKTTNIQLVHKTSENKLDIYGFEFLIKRKPSGIPVYGWLSGSIVNKWYYLKEGCSPDTFADFFYYFDELGNLYGYTSQMHSFPQPPLNEWFNILSYKFNMTIVWEFLKNWSLTAEFIYQSKGYFPPIEKVTQTQLEVQNWTHRVIYLPTYG